MIDVDIEQQLGAFKLDVQFAADAPIVGLFGPSGSGKSSVINAIAGIIKPSRGYVRVNGLSLYDAQRKVDIPRNERRIGYVFQDALLFPHMDVSNNLLYGQRLRATSDRVIDEQHVVDLLGLSGLLHRRPTTLSGGEKQRVAIGRALLAQPRILLMDEPLAALDAPRKSEILDYIERLRDDLAIPIVYVSHSVAEIARLADTVVILADGKCVAQGSVDDVMSRLDVQAVPDRNEAGSVLETRVCRHDPEYHLTTLGFDGGELVVPRLEVSIGDRVRARIRARDVSLSVRRPVDMSVLNVLAARVTGIEDTTGAFVDLQLAVGGATLLARITRRSLHQLDIRVGQQLYALVKTVSFDQRSVGYA
jgi:molybdate transport system ATP-binding protein